VSNEAPLPSDLPAAHFLINELTLRNQQLLGSNQELQQQVDWFKRQLFGEKSEKLHSAESGPLEQIWLGGKAPKQTATPSASTTVKEHARKRSSGKQELEDDCGESGLRFDSSVPVEESTCLPPEAAGLTPEEYEVIDTKVTERLCQRAGTYYVERVVRPVIKLKESGKVANAPAPASVLERSYADVSLLSGLLVDKFLYHMPLYRQHQRMLQSGIMLARANLTSWVLKTAELLSPIYDAVLSSVLTSQVLAMDETPLKAGQEKKGKLHRGYVWALYGDLDEVAFLYSPTRAMKAIEPLVKNFCGTLITDGYTVYDKLCAAYDKIEHALCWAHTRREFYEAKQYEPLRCDKALDNIGKLYQYEAEIRELKLAGDKKRQYRVEHSRPVVDTFFDWLKAEASAGALLPSNRFQKAAAYAMSREQGLRMFLANPEVPIDTNHIEREIRPLPLGRKNWLFCWTEVGAEAVATIQTLIGCCKLHGVNPFDYFVDVLQRIDSHPAARVTELTPRVWAKEQTATLTP